MFKVIRSNISNCNNSAADCPISLNFRTDEFDCGEAGLLHMFKVKCHRSRSRGQSSRSQRNVTYQQEKRPKTATDRLSDFKLGTSDEIKAGTASGCNAFALPRSVVDDSTHFAATGEIVAPFPQRWGHGLYQILRGHRQVIGAPEVYFIFHIILLHF